MSSIYMKMCRGDPNLETFPAIALFFCQHLEDPQGWELVKTTSQSEYRENTEALS